MNKNTILISRLTYDSAIVGNETILPLYLAAEREWSLFGVRLYFQTKKQKLEFQDTLATTYKGEYTIYI